MTAPELPALPASPTEWGRFYRSHLVDFVMPFWMRHGLDWEQGGLFTCLADDGRLLSTDKYLWSQTRALWTFSALCRRIEPRAEWRAASDSLFDFCRRHGRDENGWWRFRVSRSGQPQEGPIAIVVDCFAILGLVEYARLTGSAEAADLAYQAYRGVRRRLESGAPFGTHPYPLPPGMRAHRYAMQCSLAFHELWMLRPEDDILEARRRASGEILHDFLRPEHRALVEYVDADGRFSDTPAGRTVVPGHGIESMWFQLQIARQAGSEGDERRILDCLGWCLESGWDPEYGGILLAFDLFGREPVFWKFPTSKLWWPATEALCGTLLAHEADPAGGWLARHRRVAEWALARYPVPGQGEWRQRLDRAGQPLGQVVALPVKDPFHLPRALIVAVEALDRLAAGATLRAP